ncbi:MAG TPA: PIN domain-containing protein [Longimicrobiaceae bacterium]|nr:PIN domain-containing protein [Longimicrobiaceae bacterium]
MRIYLDMCSIQRPLDDRTQLRIHLEAEAVLGIIALCQAGEAELVTSAALRFETSRNPSPARRGFAENVLNFATEGSSEAQLIEQRARGYIQAGIKPLDALHLASAVQAEAEYFCTCDDRLLRRARTVDTGATRAVSPLEMIEELER